MVLSVVFSFRNEQDVIPELTRRIRAVLAQQEVEYELIFVNDDSRDGSLHLLVKLRQDDSRIKIINMSRRFGLGPCIMAGLRHARGDAVVYMDADLQDPPELIPELLREWRQGADVVHTRRTKRKGESRLKMLLTKLAYKAINVVSDIDIPENAGDYKLLSRRAVDRVIQLGEHDPFVRGLARWVGFKQACVFYEREARFAGKTHFSLFRSLNPFREFVRGITSFSALPLYLALYMGFLVALGAIMFLAWVIIARLAGVIPPQGWATIMATMLFLGGTILFTNGLLGIYVAKIHQEVKHRPPYIIESAIGFDEES